MRQAAVELCRRSEQAVAEIGRFCERHGSPVTTTAGGCGRPRTRRALERAGAQPFERLTAEQVACAPARPGPTSFVDRGASAPPPPVV